MSVKFAKYYNVTKLVEKMIKDKKLDCYPEAMNNLAGVYICSDTNDFWICRIQKNINEEYEEEDGVFLIERNRIDNWDVIEKVHEVFGKRLPLEYSKFSMHHFIDSTVETKLFVAVLLIDDWNTMENWDYWQRDSLEECIDDIADIYGIEELFVA